MRAVLYEGEKKTRPRSSDGMKLRKGTDMQLDFRDNTTVTGKLPKERGGSQKDWTFDP